MYLIFKYGYNINMNFIEGNVNFMDKTKGQTLKEELFKNDKCGFETVKNIDEVYSFCDGYISFLNRCKTERECARYFVNVLRENGFKDLLNADELKCGDKVYYLNRDKALYAAVIGKDSLTEGVNLIGAHIDSPRLDLKPNPLYEAGGFALFKTHYYGGIKKYQWTAIPLVIKGVIVLTDGKCVDVNIGENDDDPIFTITDLLPHLAGSQMKKSLADGVRGENLNLLVGSIPFDDEDVSCGVKLNILNILNKKYGIKETDFYSAELELVPAFKAKSLGFDESMIAGYGQDDRSCAYASFMSILNVQNPSKTSVIVLADKEEVGSVGNTGMYSANFEYFISLLLRKSLLHGCLLLDVLTKSKMLSADVTSACDPTYADVDDKFNAAYIGKGLALCKYTGSRGKGGASDANAEFVAYVRGIFESMGLMYQMTDMGKVDEGGGGTIAYILANKGIDVVDAGVPVLSMHAPYEVTSKFDIYNAYECYKAFYEAS